MTIAIYGRSFGDQHIGAIQTLFNELHKRKIQVVVYEPFNSYLRPRLSIQQDYKTFSRHTEIKNKCDILISIGGDGSILDSAALLRDSGIPVLGINTGRLGFLSNVSCESIIQTLHALEGKKYRIEKRSLIKVEDKEHLFGRFNFGLNELAIHRKDSGSMITIHAYLDDVFLNSYWADGLIVATPTGSTAYSLSCGGPIVMPGSDNFIITPISPHNLNVRPIVVPDDSVIKLKVEGRSNHYLVTLDSRMETLEADQELIIKNADFKLKVIRFEDQDFLSTIRNKLMWGSDKRN